MHQTVHQYKNIPTILAVLERKTEKENEENRIRKMKEKKKKRKKKTVYSS